MLSKSRHEPGRKDATSTDRIWQLYADREGIPGGSPAAAEPLILDDEVAPRSRPVARLAARTAGGLIAVLAVVLVTAVGAVIVWRTVARSPERVEARRPTTVASTPVREAAAPIGEATTPTREAAAPVREVVTTPVGETPATPVREAATTIGEAATPAKEATAIKPADKPVREARPVQSSRDSSQLSPLTTRIAFEFDSDELSGEAKTKLERLVVALKANPDWRVALEGHTDESGPADHNLWLSQRRARAVRSYLQSAGIAPGRLTVAAFGALRPLAPTDPAGNVLNRRVEIRRF